MNEFLWLALAGVIVWFWVDTLRARERAITLCRTTCRARNLQLLDQTVALASLRPARDRNGRLRLRRRYRFEFTLGDDKRHAGTIVMIGPVMETIEIPLEDGSREYQGGDS